MAIQTIPGGLWIPNSNPYTASAPAFNSPFSLSTANGRGAYIFQVPKTGTLDWFEVRLQTVTNNPDNGLRFSFQDLSVGKPDNTDDQFAVVTAGISSNAWLAPASYMGSTGGGSGSKRSVTRGDWIACVIRIESFVAGDSLAFNSINPTTERISPNTFLNTYIGTSTDAGATWSATAQHACCVALKYSDGTYAWPEIPHYPLHAINARTYNTGSTPDERGLLFQIPFPGRLSGAWARVDPDNAYDIVLYDAASSVVITHNALNANSYAASGANGYFVFSSPPTLTKNVDYRLIIKPTTGSSITIMEFDFASSAIRAGGPGGSTWMGTSRTDAGAWTDSNITLPLMGLVFDGFDDGTGGGGGGEHSAVF